MIFLAEAQNNIFTNFTWWAIVDIVLYVAMAIGVFVFFKKRNSLKIAIILAFYSLVYVALIAINGYVGDKLKISILIMHYITIGIIVAIIVVYRADFKIAFNKLARLKNNGGKYDFDTTDDNLMAASNEIVRACQNMAKNDIGALIIIAPTTVPTHIIATGTELEAKVSSGLIESIFYTKSPLHDGAVFIKNDRIISAGCFLPLSQEVDIAKELGTRHRAAIGITEESDVLAIVVSEETGIISAVRGGKIKRYMTPEKLLEELKQIYGIVGTQKQEKRRERKFL